MTKRIYGAIFSASELRAMQEAANELGLTAVGIAKDKQSYAIVDGAVTKISPSEVAEYLNCTEDEAHQVIFSRGAYEFPQEVIEEVAEPVVEEVTAEEVVEPVVEEVATEEVVEEVKEDATLTRLDILEAKIDTLLNAVEEIKKELLID